MFLEDDARLPRRVKEVLEEADHRLFLSAISAFEIAIKHGLGKLLLDISLEELLVGQLEANRIELLPVRSEHLVAYAKLPFPENGHRDPFDRLLIAQAGVEGLGLITVDQALQAYGVEPFW